MRLIILVIVGIWGPVDAFLIPSMIQADTVAKRVRISTEIGLMAAA